MSFGPMDVFTFAECKEVESENYIHKQEFLIDNCKLCRIWTRRVCNVMRAKEAENWIMLQKIGIHTVIINMALNVRVFWRI